MSLNSFFEQIEKKINTKITVGSQLQFQCVVKSFTVQKTRAGKDYATMTVSNASGSVGCKIWDAVEVSKWQGADLRNKAVNCIGTVAEYNGSYEIHITGIEILQDGMYDAAELTRSADIKALSSEFMQYYNNLPGNWNKVVAYVMGCVPNGYQRFCEEYAGSGYHDAQLGGVLNHTVKMLRILDVLLKNDPRLESLRNLLTVGVMLHDFGKIEEMNKGTYNADAYVNHRMRGVMYLSRCAREIVSLIGETDYNRLVSIVHEHHGGLSSEPMHTIYALLVFMVDNCEAQFTHVADVLSGVTPAKTHGDNTGIAYEDTFLVI